MLEICPYLPFQRCIPFIFTRVNFYVICCCRLYTFNLLHVAWMVWPCWRPACSTSVCVCEIPETYLDTLRNASRSEAINCRLTGQQKHRQRKRDGEKQLFSRPPLLSLLIQDHISVSVVLAQKDDCVLYWVRRTRRYWPVRKRKSDLPLCRRMSGAGSLKEDMCEQQPCRRAAIQALKTRV